MENKNLGRRNFIKGTTAAFAFTSLGAYAFEYGPKDKPWKVGLIGSGWYGKSDLFRLIQVANVDVVALCDPDKNMLSDAADLVQKRQRSGKKPKMFSDYRKMLADKKLDIVLIGSPDHWHALQGIEAMKSGAHVYLQKPISVDIIEGEALVAAAKKYNKVVQVGMQRRSTPHLIDAKKNIVDAGLLGKISHIEICCYYHMRDKGNRPVVEIPDFFDYDLWTGPAPIREFDGVPHRRWRAFMEYGNGIVGDMCVHMFDTVRWMLDLGWPKRVSSHGGIYVQKDAKANISDTQTAIFEFDELNCIWEHRSWGTASDPDYPWAFKIYGDKGTLKGSVQKYDFIPVGDGEEIHKDVIYEREKFPEDLTEKDMELHVAPASRGHMIDFLKAIENNTKPVADIEQGHISAASCILANMSMELGRPLVYDPKSMTIIDDPEATQLLQRNYRAPWKHPHPDSV
ncbi:Gfo/Idh/MocA family oxidoreductase [Aurantibacter crassamenti]|uniref:Gfo/Idh/MocA family protein n=1 Tax=Aurantibacter crassamenti TaxID=1837375 RepID=UPI00193A9F06|nr:Gfo/Idh/MocA family oxidoreductase [Aurantibacter crassamenti]MBM1107722.1 Gfo/Idh/MocA family oxidoreductase [Aurantibacter crassamenti]